MKKMLDNNNSRIMRKGKKGMNDGVSYRDGWITGSENGGEMKSGRNVGCQKIIPFFIYASLIN